MRDQLRIKNEELGIALSLIHAMERINDYAWKLICELPLPKQKKLIAECKNTEKIIKEKKASLLPFRCKRLMESL